MIFDFFDSPELLDIQRKGFHRFLKEDIQQLLSKEFPIKVVHGNYSIFLCLNEKNIKLIAPEDSPRDCILKMKTYNCKLYAQVKIVCKKSSNLGDDSIQSSLQIKDLFGLKFTNQDSKKPGFCGSKVNKSSYKSSYLVPEGDQIKDLFTRGKKICTIAAKANQEKKDEIDFLDESIAFDDYHTDQKVAFLTEKSDIVYESLPEWVLLGQLPMMTKRGHFIINGSPRVIVHQVVRSPGIYFQKLIKKDDQNRARFYGDIIPLKGVWVRLQMTKKGRVEAKFKKGKKVEVELLQKCLQVIESQTLLDSKLSLFLRSSYKSSSFLQTFPSVTSKALFLKNSFSLKKKENTRSLRESAYEKALGNKKSRAESKAEHDAFVHTYDKLYRTTQDKELEEWQKKKKNQKFFKEKGLGGSKAFGVTEQKAFRSRLAKMQKPETVTKQSETLHQFVVNDAETLNSFETIGQNSSGQKGSSLSEAKTFSEEYLEKNLSTNGLNKFYGHSTQNKNSLKIENLLGLGSKEPGFSNQSQDGKKKTDLRSTFSSRPNEKKNNATLNGFGGSSSKKAKPLSFTEQNSFLYPGVSQNFSMKTAFKKALVSKNGGDFVLEPSQQKKVKFLLSKKEKMYGSLFCKKGISARSKRAFGTRKPENAFKRKKCSEALFATFKSSSRYSLGKLGREKINNRFGLLSFPEGDQKQEITSLSSLMIEMRHQTKVKKNQVFGEKRRFSVYKNEFLDKVYTTQLTSLDLCYATIWLYRLRKGEESTDDIDHSQNRRVRTSGELLQTQFENGVYRLKNLLSTKLREWKGDMSASSFSKFFKESYKPRYNSKLVIKSGAHRFWRRARKVKFTRSFRKEIFALLTSTNQRFVSKVVPGGDQIGNLLPGGDPRYATNQRFVRLCKQIEDLLHIETKSALRQWPQLQLKQTTFCAKQYLAPSKVKKVFGKSKPVRKFVRSQRKQTKKERSKYCIHTKQNFFINKVSRSLGQRYDYKISIPTIKELFSTKPITGALREFFGSNPLSQYMDQTNPLAEITHKRRISSLGLGGVSRDSAGMAIRGIHPTHYGRICPIETPEGKNAGLVNSLAFYTKVDESGFLKTPYYRVFKGQIQASLGFSFCSAKEESSTGLQIAPSDLQKSFSNVLRTKASTLSSVPVRVADNFLDVFKKESPYNVQLIAISPIQMISVATSLIPFLEHNDANRALMGSNMQRQAVPLMISERPVVGTGLESTVIVESGHITESQISGFASHVTANQVIIDQLLQKVSQPALCKAPFYKPDFCKNRKLNLYKTGDKVLSLSTKQSFGKGFGYTEFARKANLKFVNGDTTRRAKIYKEKFHRLPKVTPLAKRMCNKSFYKSSYLATLQIGDLSDFAYKSPICKQSKSKICTCKKICICKRSEVRRFVLVSGKESHLSEQNLHLKKLQDLRAKFPFLTNCLGKGQSIVPRKNSQNLSQKKEGSFLHSTVSLLTTFSRSNQNTSITEKPLLREFDWVQKGDILTDCSASNKGELAVGKNVLLAYIPWEGYNFEDAIVISDRLVREHVYTSLHIERYVFQAQDLKEGAEWFTKHLPGVKPFLIQHLEESGLPKIGSFLKEGDIIVGKIRYLAKKPSSPYERLLCDILGEKNFAARNKSLYVPKGVEARVIYHKVISAFENDLDNKVRPPEAAKTVHIFLGEKRVIQVGDKISGRHGNKGVISTILPRQDMPYLPDGTPIDLILNPLGVPSRMNVGQVLECLLGLAASYLDSHFKIAAFDEKYGVEASKSIVFLKLYQARLMSGQNWLFQVSFPGKTRLVDGRSGECFDQWITVGKAYILKLIHMVSEKIHARSTGPYALITQQPLRGRSNKGGQRLGEMEVWALEGFGAAYTLQELLTKKSDDFFGRKQIVDSILPNPASIIDRLEPSYRIAKGRDVLGHPEIFKVLLCELQALCLDLGVYIVTPESFQRTFLGVVH